MHRNLGLGLLVVTAMFVAAGCNQNAGKRSRKLAPAPKGAVKEGVSEGYRARDIVGVDADGQTFKLSDYRGKVVLLDFWFEQWRHCMAMVPHERSLVERLQDKPFVLLGINVDSSTDALKSAQDKHRITWRSWWDGSRRIASRFRVRGYPTLFLLDQDGIIRREYLGRPPDSELERDVMQLVAEAEKAA